MQGSVGAHTDVVLHVSGGGDSVRAGGMRKDLVFRAERGGSILQEHETGIQAAFRCQEARQEVVVHAFVQHFHDATLRYVAQIGEGDTEEVHGKGERLAMEIAAGDNFGLILLIKEN